MSKPVSTRRRRQSAQKSVDAILCVTELVMALDKEARFTICQVAEILEISPSTIYHHFGSKDALAKTVQFRLAATQRDILPTTVQIRAFAGSG